MSNNPHKKLQIIHLGGQEEIGKNMTAVKYGSNILLIDCGMKFPGDDLPGIDVIVPDMSFLSENRKFIRGLVITHGHEDHIGGIPYLLRDMNIPIWGSRLALGLIEHRLKEHGISKAKMTGVKPGTVINMGPFKVEFIRVNHSIPDSFAVAVTTPVGVLFHTGDFKIDHTPVDGEKANLDRMRELGSKGVLVLMSDSTNADSEGYTPSEKTVGKNLDGFFAAAKKRIIIASFASSIHRIQQIFDCAHKHGRKVAVSGLSMKNVVGKAKEMGYLKIPHNTMISLDEIGRQPQNKLVILTTGSQGEPMSALSRMANGSHKQVEIQKGDTVIISAIAIPGNEKSVFNNINRLFKRGAEVIYEEKHGIHVSGHGSRGDLKTVLNLIKPRYFIPTHGEFRHLVMHAKLAVETGIRHENIFIDENGDTIEISKGKAVRGAKVPASGVLIDESGFRDVGEDIMKERRQLSESGSITIGIAVSRKDLRLLDEIKIETKGFVFSRSGDLAKKACESVKEAVALFRKKKSKDLFALRQEIKKQVRKLVLKGTEREPVITLLILQA
ncbi:MAG: ribonuclease J [Candidatus Margulisiibacteriota bacterium]